MFSQHCSRHDPTSQMFLNFSVKTVLFLQTSCLLALTHHVYVFCPGTASQTVGHTQHSTTGPCRQNQSWRRSLALISAEISLSLYIHSEKRRVLNTDWPRCPFPLSLSWCAQADCPYPSNALTEMDARSRNGYLQEMHCGIYSQTP